LFCFSEKYVELQGILLYGTDLRVASVILPPPKHGSDLKQEAEKRLRELKAYNLPEKHSFAIMLACIGRGEGMYEENGVESAIFHKLFPDTPLVGLFGNGEIGCDFSDNPVAATNDMKRRKSALPKLFHSYTTVFVLVAYD